MAQNHMVLTSQGAIYFHRFHFDHFQINCLDQQNKKVHECLKYHLGTFNLHWNYYCFHLRIQIHWIFEFLCIQFSFHFKSKESLDEELKKVKKIVLWWLLDLKAQYLLSFLFFLTFVTLLISWRITFWIQKRVNAF